MGGIALRAAPESPGIPVPMEHDKNTIDRLARLPVWGLIGLVRLYQWTLGPILGGRCRFYPSCSEYFIQAVKKHGAVSGALRGLGRLLRCHPFHPGGYDPP